MAMKYVPARNGGELAGVMLIVSLLEAVSER
jgi:hypothetical protein